MVPNTYFTHCKLAGFAYHHGAEAFTQLKIGTQLELAPEPDNPHDINAVAVFFKEYKLGYIPKNQNTQLAALLNAGHQVFSTRVQTLAPQMHPEEQIQIVIHVTNAKSEKTH